MKIILFMGADNHRKLHRQAAKIYEELIYGNNDAPPYIIAIKEEVLLGALWVDKYFHPSFGEVSEIEFAVAPRHQGLGVGKSMVRRFIEMHRFDKGFIIARPMNEISKALLKSSGFTESEASDQYWIHEK